MAEAVVGGAFLSDSIQVLFDRMASRGQVLNYIQGHKLNGALLKKLKIALQNVNAVLKDAEVKQITNPAVREWTDELKDAVYHAEDLLDQIATKASRYKMNADIRMSAIQVRNTNSASLSPFVEGVESKVEEFIDRLEFLAQQKEVLGLKKWIGEKLPQRWPSTSVVDESGVYGRGADKEEIIKFLLSDGKTGNGICVISIVGAAGVGKTTLAQLVYHDRRVERHFDLRAWVCVADEFDLFRVTKEILEATNSGSCESCDMSSLNLLQVKLKERLDRKKFLLVLDDVWNENYNNWDLLQIPLRFGSGGSKIIVTTRNRRVALVMRAAHTYRLPQLSFEDCWSLFARHAFENGDSSPYPKLEEIGKEIVKKCNGLPLAAKTLGGVLYSNVEADKWDDVLKSQMWGFPGDEILPALRLSYYYLPSHLKRCFAYCSIFPKGYEVQKESLILLWMAEGLLQQPKDKKRGQELDDMEELGDQYFEELLSRSLFEKSRSNKSGFVMHDLVNDLAQLVSGEFCIRLESGEADEIVERARHLSYFRSECDALERFEILVEVKCLRSFLPLQMPDFVSVSYLSNRVLHGLLPTLSCLRVLSLCGYQMFVLFDSIGNLQHLRYLDLSSTRIKRLPESICSLYNLQTLILAHCRSLSELPTGMRKLTNLRYLDINYSGVKEMPSQVGRLKNLRTLTTFIVGKKSGTRIGELKKLSHIRGRLCISKLQNVTCGNDGLEAIVKNKKHLDELILQWDEDSDVLPHGSDILDNLEPHTNTKKLTISSYGGTKYPAWLGDPSFSNIFSINLFNCKHCSSLPPLGQLPFLKHLFIKGMDGVEKVGSEFYGNGSNSVKSFTSLETLTFESLSEWKQWLFFGGKGGEFPRLKELAIRFCPKLSGDLPNHLPLLTKLEVYECQRLESSLPSAPAICKLKILNCGEVMLRSPAFGFISVEKLEVSDISEWNELPLGLKKLSVEKCESLESLLEGMMQSNTSIHDLEITNCSLSRPLIRGGVPTTLKSLRICNSRRLELLLPEFLICHHPFLERLYITGGTCFMLSSLSFGIFPRLTHLHVENLKGLECLSILTPKQDRTSLTFCNISGCPDLVSIELPALNLSRCEITRCNNLKSLLHSSLSSYQKLILGYCPELLFPTEGLPRINIHSLVIENCHKLTPKVEWALNRLASLTYFRICNGCKDIESFPDECLLPSTLTSLEISGLPNLKSLDNKGLQQLTSLKKLKISDCPELQSLAQAMLPTSLSFLEIKNCPLLKHGSQFTQGEYWQYITQIPHIVIDGQAF